jgi:hypothetical protein
MKKNIRHMAVFVFALFLVLCFGYCKLKKRIPPAAVKKIMTVQQATAFLKNNKENEGRVIIIKANCRGLLQSSFNSAALSLEDKRKEDENPKTYLDEISAFFGKEATEYARAVPKDATVTVSGKLRYADGKIRLEECKLIAQN